MKKLKTLFSALAVSLPMMLTAQVVYDFDSGNGLSQMTLGAGATAPVVTGTYSDNTTNTLALNTGGQSCAASLNAFSGSTDCQVVWKQYYSDLFVTETKAGVVLRSTNRTSTYASGLKTGYYFFLHTNQFGGNSGKVTFRMMKVTTTNVVSLTSSAATTVTGYAANAPLWLRAKAVGNVLTLDYSINGTTWTNALSYTDGANTFPNAGPVQLFWGLGAVMASKCAVDNISITNLDVAKVTLTGSNKYAYDGTAKGPASVTTARFSTNPTVTYTYQGVGATVYAASSTRPTDAGTYLASVSATDGTNTATDQMAFEILPPMVAYLFNSDQAGANPTNISFRTNKSGTGVVESYSTGTSNTYKTTALMFKPNTGGASNATYVADLNAVATSASYSVTWKQYITATGQKRGFLLAAQNATTADGATTAGDTSSYAIGLKKGYFFCVYDNGTTNTEMRLYKSIYSGITNLYVQNNKSVPAAATIGAARWYRATVAANSQKFEYSDDGKTWVLATEGTDATYQPVAGNKIQAVGGLGGFDNKVFYDYIGYTDNTVAPQVGLNGTVVYPYNGSAQTPTAVATGFTTPTTVYTYTGSGSTTYGPSASAPVNAGTYTVSATATEGATTATSSTMTYTIAKATPSLSVSGTQNYTYNGLPQAASTVSYNGDGTTTLTYSSTDGAEYSSTTKPSNYGAYQVKATSTAGTFYNSGASDYYTFSIAQVPLTITGISIASKVYDGNTTATIAGTPAYVGLVNSETFAVGGTPVAAFADNALGTGKAVTVSGYAAPASGNYTLTQPSGFTAGIYPVACVFAKTGSANWSTTTNWTYMPVAGTELEIQSGELVVDQSASLKSITVKPGAKLTLNTGITLTAQTLNLTSDATGTATFVNNGTLSGVQATVGQTLSAGRDWYVSSPISNGLSQVFGAQNNANKLLSYDETTNTWPAIADSTTALKAMKGYVAHLAAPAAIAFKGTLNDGNLTYPLTKSTGDFAGYNLVGNPYPSYLDWQAVATANPTVGSSIWFRTKTIGNASVFATYNATGNIAVDNGSVSPVTKLIPPMQGFWVLVADTTHLNLTNAMRAHADQATNRLRSASVDQQIIRLVVSNDQSSDETVLYADERASSVSDAFDAPKMFNGNVQMPEIGTVSGNQVMVINGVDRFAAGMEMPLYFGTGTSGSFSITAKQLTNLPADLQVLLRDRISGKTLDLTEGAAYNFVSDAVSGNDRFSLSFHAPTALTNPTEASVQVIGTAARQIEVAANGLIGSTTVRVYNAIGQLVASQQVQTGKTILNIQPGAGLYVVKVGQYDTFKVVMP